MMQTRYRSFRPVVATLTLAAALSGAAQTAPSRPHAHSPAAKAARAVPAARVLAPLTEEEKATQVLSRFTFGPRPGEIADVARTGWENWFEPQLNPAAIPDPILERRLAQYPSLAMTPQQIAVNFPDGVNIRRVAEGKLPMPSDPMLAGAYEVMLLRYNRKQAEDKAAAAASASPVPASAAPMATPPTALPIAAEAGKTVAPIPAPATSTTAVATTEQQKAAQKQQDQKQAAMLADQVLGYPKNLRMQAIMKLPVEQRLILAGNVADPQKMLLQNDFNPREKELFALMNSGYGGNGVAGNELVQAKLLRAVLSERQLQEVMTDFWFNHFNVDLSKSGDEINYLNSYERDAIRPHALGKFRDLLLATAEHPAMLIYLDNWLSIGPDSQAAARPKPNQKSQGAQKGLNENYGREVMELHTVSVNGGYSQADVTNLAKILTGWTVDQPQMGGGFLFQTKRHEPGAKQWFGQKITDNGYQEGVNALTWLAAQPQTAHFISLKLAQRFVADEPPAALVDRMAATYLSTDGDIKAVLETMVHSPEFFSRANYRNKVKMPLEFVASAFRATSTDPTNPQALVGVMKTMDEPLYRCQPPTGYAATADHWMNSAALVDRLNFSLQLTGSKVGGIKFDGPRLLAAGLLDRPGAPAAPNTQSVALHTLAPTQSGEDEALRLMEQQLIAGQVSDRTNAVIKQELAAAQAAQQQATDPAQTLNSMAAMILGSPEFQMH